MKDFLSGLNEAQVEAVKSVDGPVLMLAGAGSGKTKALTHRIAYLVGEQKVPPNNILAVTFTNKAAQEMRSRVAGLLGFDSEFASPLSFLGTFHAIANKILRREATRMGFNSNFVIYDTNDTQALIKKILRSLHVDDKSITPSGIAWVISSAKNELVGPEKYRSLASSRVQLVAADVYPVYQRELRSAKAMDFDDLIMELVRLFQNEHEVLEKYQNQFQYILIDEYQDTNHAQYQMIKLLAAKHKNLCVVGDDWQSIYSWRGANYQNILNFESDYPDAKVVKLEQNYRSTQRILDAAHNVISKNISRSKKKLWTELGLGEKVHVIQVPDELAEARTIIQTIERLRGINPSLKLKDFAVLYRTNAQSRSLEECFLRYGIAYQVVGGMKFYDRKEVKDVLAYLRLLFQPNDMVSLSRIINVPTRGVGAKSASLLIDYLNKHEADTFETMRNAEVVEGLRGKVLKQIKDLGIVLGELSAQQSISLYELAEMLIKRIDYMDYLQDGSISAEDRVENVKELLGVMKSYNELDLETFLSDVALVSDLDAHKADHDSVSLMTLHSAKGLEFDVVFMVGMEEGVFPHSRSLFGAEELEEERRLCYVGMTRARQQLYMIHASARLLYGNTQHNLPSRFIADIPEEIIDAPNSSQSFTSPGFSTEDFADQAIEQPNLEVGEAVQHPLFGNGVVESLEDFEATIMFARVGRKRLNLQYAPLKKI